MNENDNRTLRINMLCSVLQQKDPGFLEIYDIPRVHSLDKETLQSYRRDLNKECSSQRRSPYLSCTLAV